MADFFSTAILQLDAVLSDGSLTPEEITSYVAMARDHVLLAMSRETNISLCARIDSGEMRILQNLILDQSKSEIIQYTYSLGSSRDFFYIANNDEFGIKSLLMAMLTGPAFCYRYWRQALSKDDLNPEIDSYLFASPKVFLTDEEREQFLAYTTDLCNLLGNGLEQGASSFALGRVARFLSRFRNGVAYSCEGSTIELAKAKGNLITRYVDCIMSGDTLDFTPTFNIEGPIRVGLLWSDIARRTENIVGVASCSMLREAGFHVTSFIFSMESVTGFNKSFADRINLLSDEIIYLNDNAEYGVNVIRNSSIDVLIIQNNITWGYSPLISLCSRKLAPIQAVNFCAVVTTGMPSITTYISGSMSEPSLNPQDFYTENLALLEGSCLIFDDHDYGLTPPTTGKLSQFGLTASQTVFASGANFYKLHPNLTATWIDILREVPDSVLILYPFNPNWDWHYPWSILKRRLETQCFQQGVDPSRIIVSGAWRDSESLRELLTYVDIYLDSFPHSGGLSSLDAIAQSIPIVTFAGDTQRQNQTADLLSMLDLKEMITYSSEEYIQEAVALAHNPEHWADMKQKLFERWAHGEYFNSRRYAKGLTRLVRNLVPNRIGILG